MSVTGAMRGKSQRIDKIILNKSVIYTYFYMYTLGCIYVWVHCAGPHVWKQEWGGGGDEFPGNGVTDGC